MPRGGRAAVASGAVVALTAATLGFFAVSSRGETVHEADLADGGVWVTSSSLAKYGRFNKPARQLDQGVAASVAQDSGLDVLQDGAAVLGLPKASSGLTAIDVRTGKAAELSVAVPAPQAATADGFAPSPVDLRGGSVAMVDPRSGKVWAQRVDPRASIRSLDSLSTSAKPVATVGPVAAVAVGTDGAVHAVSGATGKVVTLRPAGDAFAKPVVNQTPVRAKAVDISAVGKDWVVLDNDAGRIVTAARADTPVPTGLGASGALQQPGPAADGVAVQSATALAVLSLDGDKAPSGGASTPAKGRLSRPAVHGGCVHAAWAQPGTVQYAADCGGQERVTAQALDNPPGEPVRDGVEFRTNRGLMVLNDLDNGGLWDMDSKPVKIDNWDALLPPPLKDDKNKKKDKNLYDENQLNQPPKAEPDSYQVRAGRTSKLHVLDNDTDPAGSVLAIAPEDLTAPDVEGVQAGVAADGQSLDITVPAGMAGRTVKLGYAINNGKSPQKSRASVTVTVVDEAVNNGPYLRPGTATLAKTLYPVIQSKRIAVGVVGDWRDPECDPVTADALTAGTVVDGLGRLSVLAPPKPGPASVRYEVNDGRGGKASGTVSLKVLDLVEGQPVNPKTQPDVVRGVVGKPVQVEPLANDVPGADPAEPDATMRLASAVRAPGGALKVDTNPATGVVTITGRQPGTFELSYGAVVGGAPAAGRIRVDMAGQADPDAPPVAVPDAATLRDQTPVMTDVLANDYSPRSDVLVTQSVSVATRDGWLRPSIYQGRWVRIEALEPAPLEQTAGSRRGTVTYTVSDGTKKTTGEIAVVQKAPLTDAVPIVEDDRAVVRATDAVTIPVMDNDSMADGIPLKLNPKVEVLGGGRQTAFASGSVVRFVPNEPTLTAQKDVTLEYSVYPEGMPDRAKTGRVTVSVMPEPTTTQPNQAPVARSFSASVVAGESLTITVPTSGIDPDGDQAAVTGVVGADDGAVELTRGRVVGVTPTAIRYEAYPRASGTEVINYELTDRFGATSQAFIRVGVVPPSDPQPPVAVPDEVVAAPGKTVTKDVLENDLISRGDSIELEYKELNDSGVLRGFKVDEQETTASTKVPEDGKATQLVYGITNGLFDPSRSSLLVRGQKGFVNPPVAVDDVAKAEPGRESVLVDVLANDRDIDGDAKQLQVVETLSPKGTVEGRRVRVKVEAQAHTVPYVIRDSDNQTAMALIYVPPGNNGAPFVVSGALIQMDKDATKQVKLSDYVKSPRARVVGITSAATLSASPSDRLRVESQGKGELKLTSSGGYVGPGSVMLEVTDQTSAKEQDFQTAYVTVPVQVGPKVPLLRCPEYAVTLNAAGRSRDFDIPSLCRAWVPIGMTLDDASFESEWDPAAPGVRLERSGAGDRQVRLTADASAPSSTTGRIRVKASGAPEAGWVKVRVIGLPKKKDKVAQAKADQPKDKATKDDKKKPEEPVYPPPRLRPITVNGLKAGESRTVDLRAYLDSPLKTPQCSVPAASVESGTGLTVRPSGCSLVFTATDKASPTATVRVVVSDGPDRVANGRATVTMLRRPEPPTGVTAEADRIAGGQARVSWQPPTVTGGSPITRYTVSWTGAGSGSKECTSSPCTITGLSNGKDYSFTVTATNAVGTSAPSAPFGPVRPDTKPGAPAAPRMATRGDGSLGIGWPAAPNTGSPISKYTVRVVSSAGGVKTATTTGAVLTATVSGLVNNDTQSVSVQAWNGAGAGPFGATATMQSAGTPPALPAPGIDHTGAGPGVDTSSVTLTWPAADPNGPAITAYTIHRRVAGGAWAVLSTAGSDARSAKDTVAFDGQRYDYAVTATNGAGKTSAMSAPAGFVANGYPDAPSISAVDNGPTKQARLTVTLGKARSGGYGRIDWRSSSGASGSYPCGSGCPVGQGIAITTGELPLGDQTFTATAVNSAGNTATSGASGAVSPYGPTPAPANGRSSVNAQNVTYGWDLPTNGRPVDAVQLIGPRGATHDLGAGATSWSYTGAWSSDATVRVRAHSAAGWSGYLTIGATIGAAPPPPPPPPAPKPTISNVWKGPVTTVTIGSCTSGSCYRIDYSGSGIPDGTYTLACYVDNGTSPFFTTTGATVRGGQPTYDHYCALGGWRTNARIVLTGNGKTIDSGWHPWQ